MTKPVPKDEEIIFDPDRFVISKTDPKGYITYANEFFCSVCLYNKDELKGVNHNIIRHPDMPKIAFKLMWDTIKSGKKFKALVKNLAKDGRYYWVFAEVEPHFDPTTGEIVSYTAYRKAPSREAIAAIEPIYKALISKEQVGGMSASLDFLNKYLADNQTTYDELIDSLTKDVKISRSGIFNFIKNLFSKKSW
ncbi:PAS domain-containing protein [Campylobacter corcagiensis]|uniref:PAS domain-containing protein n=1 Tax=Campylobacter corcagiensis TaxID=1448857 RepID=A0A7M1LEJ7_9BACT|nr:PAS domain-containing protein [Campylobacter corcagiensis]QKF64973.1 PAS sensor-containing signal transduction protein [Campylobacter corcagiensis]QOQ86870.1 PAS domain-containing protein [Campylobacter corcagiensis]